RPFNANLFSSKVPRPRSLRIVWEQAMLLSVDPGGEPGGNGMLARAALNCIMEDDGLTRNLGDAEARLLVEWIVDQAETIGETHSDDVTLTEVKRLCRRGRAVSRFVRLWSIEEDHS